MASTYTPRLEVYRVSKSFEHRDRSLEVLRDVSLEVEAGSFVSLLGPSGCGKTTLLQIIGGLVRPDQGSVLLDGEEITAAGAAGYMPQKDLLLPWRTLLQNVTLGPEVDGRSRWESEAQARELLERFGLGGFEESNPAQLSGGMRQRAALLRAVMYQSRFLILDEPLSALDALTRLELQVWLADLVVQLGSTAVMVTHDIREALLLSDEIYLFTGRPARVCSKWTVPGPRPRAASDLSEPEMAKLESQLASSLLEPA